MCTKLLRHKPEAQQGRLYRASEHVFQSVIGFYGKTLQWVLKYQAATLLVAIAMLGLTIWLYIIVPKGFFPVQDTGVIQGISEAQQSISFPAMSQRQQALAQVILKDPAVASLSSFIGVDGTNTTLNSGRILINLKPLEDRKISAAEVIRRLQPELAKIDGITLYMQPVQDLTVEDRVSRTQYQYTLEAPDSNELNTWASKVVDKLKTLPQLRDVATDQQTRGLQTSLVIDRVTASRMGITPLLIVDTLYDAFGQRQVSTLFTQLNQYHVVLETMPDFQRNPAKLHDIYVRSAAPAATPAASLAGIGSGATSSAPQVSSIAPAATPATSLAASAAIATSTAQASGLVAAATPATGLAASAAVTTSAAQASSLVAAPGFATSTATGTSVAQTSAFAHASAFTSNGGAVPLSAFAHFESGTAPLSINHQGQFPVVTISFNLAPGAALGEAITAVEGAQKEIGMPASIQPAFQGTAAAFQASLTNQPLLILAALVTVYIVLGVLYESYIHPITILSTLPSAGVGAILALMVSRSELGVVAIIGIILLIGIVKKNAIMMIDFALDAERNGGKSPLDAIYEACLLRFRPIMMTTMTALLAGLALAFGSGIGSELRRPLGITIVGGLLVSQLLTLYTTPVIYLFFDRFARRFYKR